MIRLLTIAALLTFTPLVATSAMAQSVGQCDWRASAQALLEPWDDPDNTRTFANGDVRLAVLDTIEPAAGAFHLMMLSPPYDELAGRQCQVISARGDMGFAGLSLAGMQADYDPAVGLIFTLNTNVFDDKSADIVPRVLRVTLNQATGEITTALQER